jgi:hypothetical protein
MKFKLFSIALLLAASSLSVVNAQSKAAPAKTPAFKLSFASTADKELITGRMFLIVSHSDTIEPRLQVGRYGTQFFGVDVMKLAAGKEVTVDAATLGYPVNKMKDIPPGDYYVQAMVSKYTEFKRSDGHTLWMHMDQWEGQKWQTSPGNIYSKVMKVSINKTAGQVIKLSADQVVPPIPVPPDTKWVKHIKIQSEKLTKFWGHPIYIGATILLPKGYDEHPDKKYPSVYQQGHFTTAPPFGFKDDAANGFYKDWTSAGFPEFIAITLQHPSPYFDDSYAVNTPNNGPFGDAIHEELIPQIEKKFRCIPEGWARLLTGGSTGGWESFALQCLYPEFYGGTWSYSPDPLDFHNVEGIDVYNDKNAFYKIHEWYKVPTINTRWPLTGDPRLTSEQRNTMEVVNGTLGRSGGQLDIWSSVFGPIGTNGYFKPLFDKSTGEINKSVAQYWIDNWDMRVYLQKNWTTVGPKLVGKLNIIAGRMDDFFLNFGVYHMEDFLSKTTNPYYGGTITYGERGGHSYRNYTNGELIKVMDAHLKKMHPAYK